MTEHRFTDAAPIVGPRKTQDGYLVAEAFVARSGVQFYTGDEVGLVGKPVVRVWRPEDEVKAPASVRTYSHAPITLGHPAESVTKDNWQTLAKGEVSTEAEWKDGRLRLPLIVKDAAAIAAIDGGTRELSAGYTCRLEIGDGVTPEGEAYDAVQRDIRINHLAIVPKGRAGSEFRIGDEAGNWGAAPITTGDKQEVKMTDALKTVVLGDKAAQVAAADATIIEQFKTDTAKRLSDMETAHAAAIASKDEEIGSLKAENQSLKDAAPKPADLDKLVADRAALVTDAKAIAKDVKVDGVSDAEIRKAAVAAKLGDDAVKDASDAEIKGMFKVLSKDAAKGDPVVRAISSAPIAAKDAASIEDAAYQAYLGKFNRVKKEA